jgi:hypothetical protein
MVVVSTTRSVKEVDNCMRGGCSRAPKAFGFYK